MSEESQFWRVCPLGDCQVPSEPTTEAVRKGVRSLWRRLRDRRALEPEGKIVRGADRETVRRFAPDWDWSKGAAALEDSLGEWLDGGSGVRLIVGGPFSGTVAAVQTLARERSLETAGAPLPDELLEGGKKWLAGVEQQLSEGPLVVSRLERCVLRHPDGFDCLRGLLDLLAAGRGRCLVQCQSWAWAFLQRLMAPESVLGTPLALAPLDRESLSRWVLARLAEAGSERLVLRRADDGEAIWSRSDADASGLSEMLHHVTGRGRGQAEVVLAIWRECLGGRPEDEEKAPAAATGDDRETAWLTPWSRLDLPAVPSTLERSDLFTLHALLVHGGLRAGTLARLFSVSAMETNRSLARLKSGGLVGEADGCWQVLPLAYPAVRDHLGREGFLRDSL